jgi:hypothetical protein
MKKFDLSTILPQNYDQTLVCLKKNVLYVALADGAGPIYGKVISINDKKSFKPNGDTAALLLYLLVCDDDDPILLSDFLNLATTKFSGAGTSDVMDFLKKLNETHKILKIRTGGGSGTNDPDPLGKFAPPQVPWGPPNPDIIPDQPQPICNSNTFYSQGYWPVIIPK